MDRSFKGQAKRIEDVDIPRIAHRIDVGEDELHAFMDVEAAGTGFDRQGRPKMLFEPHVFYRNLTGAKRTQAVNAGLAYKKWGMESYPIDSYPRLLKAMDIDETAALKSCSWGLTQILGENYAMAGYDSVQAMVEDFMDDEEKHLEAAVNFIVSAGLDDELRELAALNRLTVPLDCVAFVRGYNGSGYKKNRYHEKFAAAHNRWRKIKDTPWSPEEPTVEINIYDGQVYSEVMAVQKMLDELGYPEVGALDGRWGTKTRAAVLSFRADNDLPVQPVIDDALLAALVKASPRKIAPERANATVADLREKGAQDVKVADTTQTIGGIAAAGGVLTGLGKMLEDGEAYGGMIRGAAEILVPIQEIVVENFWLVLLGIGGVVIWQTGVLKRIRLMKHQTGQDVSE